MLKKNEAQQGAHAKSPNLTGARSDDKTTNGAGVSAAMVQKYLKGIVFPVNKRDLIKQAKRNNAPDDVTTLLDRLEDQDYENVTEISKEIGKFAA